MFNRKKSEAMRALEARYKKEAESFKKKAQAKTQRESDITFMKINELKKTKAQFETKNLKNELKDMKKWLKASLEGQ